MTLGSLFIVFEGTGKGLEFCGAPWGPDLDFSRFLMDFGSSLGPTLESC